MFQKIRKLIQKRKRERFLASLPAHVRWDFMTDEEKAPWIVLAMKNIRLEVVSKKECTK